MSQPPIRPVALVTGANKGIGLEIARRLGERRFRVWLGCRDADRGERAAEALRGAGLDARALVLDVADDGSVAEAAARLAELVDRLDVLVNSAGISIDDTAPITRQPIDDIRTMFEVNALGPVRVTQAFLPLLRRSDAARVVMMSSGLASLSATLDMTSNIWPAMAPGYCATKSALNMITVKFAKELLNEGIKVNAADPGYTATDLTGHGGPRSPEQGAAIAVELATLGGAGPTGGFFHDGYNGSPAPYPW